MTSQVAKPIELGQMPTHEAPSLVPSSIPDIISLLVRHRVLILATGLLLAMVMGLIPLVKPRTYTAGASFILSSGRQQGARLGNVAEQFGINIGGGTDAARSPDFYADLLTSRAILEQVVRAPITVNERQSTLVQQEGYASPTTQAVRETASKLRESISVRMETQTGLVSVSVAQKSPALAERVASLMLETLNRFNLEVRRSQASMERAFVAGQLDNARSDLRAAENNLESFLASNRTYTNSPDLTLRRGRLEREVSLRQRLVESLSESLERARIDEVRDAPVITVIDPPAAASRPDPRGVVARTLVGAILGTMLGVFLAVANDYRKTLRLQRD